MALTKLFTKYNVCSRSYEVIQGQSWKKLNMKCINAMGTFVK